MSEGVFHRSLDSLRENFHGIGNLGKGVQRFSGSLNRVECPASLGCIPVAAALA